MRALEINDEEIEVMTHPASGLRLLDDAREDRQDEPIPPSGVPALLTTLAFAAYFTAMFALYLLTVR